MTKKPDRPDTEHDTARKAPGVPVEQPRTLREYYQAINRLPEPARALALAREDRELRRGMREAVNRECARRGLPLFPAIDPEPEAS